MTFGLDHIQLAIPPGTEAKAREFWCGIVGLDEIEKPEALRARGGLWLQLGSGQLHLGIEADHRPARKAHPGFRTSDIDALVDRLGNSGIPIRWDTEIPGRRRFYTEDPFGNRLEFLQDPPTR